jgi:hypothetical protein
MKETTEPKWEKLTVEYCDIDIAKELQSFGNYFQNLQNYSDLLSEKENLKNDAKFYEFINDLVERMYYYHIYARPNLDFDKIEPLRSRRLYLPEFSTIGYTGDILGHDIAQHLMSGVMLTKEADGPNSYYKRLHRPPTFSKIESDFSTSYIEKYFDILFESETKLYKLFIDGYGFHSLKLDKPYIKSPNYKVKSSVKVDGTLKSLSKFLKLGSIESEQNDFFLDLKKPIQEVILAEFLEEGESKTLKLIQSESIDETLAKELKRTDIKNSEHRFNQLINLEQLKMSILEILKALKIRESEVLDSKIAGIRNNISFWNQLFESNPEEFSPGNTSPKYPDYTFKKLLESYKVINKELQNMINYINFNKEIILDDFGETKDCEETERYIKMRNYKQEMDVRKLNKR